jgi:hypothetical protein
VGDANRLTAFADASFDVVYLTAVFHWLPEKRGPLAEFRRVLEPGGRLALSTGEKGRNTLRAIRRSVLSREPFRQFTAAEDDLGHNVTQEELRALLLAAGFEIRQLDVIPHQTHHASARAAVEFAQASSFGNFLGRLPDPLRLAARLEIEAELEKLRTPEGILDRAARRPTPVTTRARAASAGSRPGAASPIWTARPARSGVSVSAPHPACASRADCEPGARLTRRASRTPVCNREYPIPSWTRRRDLCVTDVAELPRASAADSGIRRMPRAALRTLNTLPTANLPRPTAMRQHHHEQVAS